MQGPKGKDGHRGFTGLEGAPGLDGDPGRSVCTSAYTLPYIEHMHTYIHT